MEQTLLEALTVEQLEAELKRRKEVKVEKLEAEEETEEKLKHIEKETLKTKLRNIIASIDISSIYHYIQIKKDIEELKKYQNEFSYPERIEKLLNNEMEIEKYE